MELTVIKDNMLKNHGYYRVDENGQQTAVISADCGVFQFVPPETPGSDWEIRTLLKTAASDAVLVDMDEDGEKELAVLSPFHGDNISFYKKKDGVFEKVYEYEKPAEFTHAIFGGMLCGKPAVVIGHRKAERNLVLFTWNPEKACYESAVMDEDCGPANVLKYSHNGKEIIISANREIDEVAMYTVEL